MSLVLVYISSSFKDIQMHKNAVTFSNIFFVPICYPYDSNICYFRKRGNGRGRGKVLYMLLHNYVMIRSVILQACELPKIDLDI